MFLTILAILAFAWPPIGAQAQNPVSTSGKYRVELRIPPDGLFSGEEVDIEFRLSDLSKDDPILGPAGVPNARVSAEVWMPSMPGMPKAKPDIHTEGVPGDYGIVAYFPHGGEYQIDLTIVLTGGGVARFSLKVDVGDDRPSGRPADKPYYLELVDMPHHIAAGSKAKFGMAVKDAKTKRVVKDFDVAHEKRFHLIIVSQDLGYFIHEHPNQRADGVWDFEWTFPSGGEYWVYGDVAPAGKGAQVLSAKLRVTGSPAQAHRLVPSPSVVSADGVSASVSFAGGTPVIGKMSQVGVKLSDERGEAIHDLEPYLGAFGHLMIIHQDGQTFVHSHPDESESANSLAKEGSLTFNARIPRSGMYKGWIQVQRAGKIVTIPFVFEAKS